MADLQDAVLVVLVLFLIAYYLRRRSICGYYQVVQSRITYQVAIADIYVRGEKHRAVIPLEALRDPDAIRARGDELYNGLVLDDMSQISRPDMALKHAVVLTGFRVKGWNACNLVSMLDPSAEKLNFTLDLKVFLRDLILYPSVGPGQVLLYSGEL